MHHKLKSLKTYPQCLEKFRDSSDISGRILSMFCLVCSLPAVQAKYPLYTSRRRCLIPHLACESQTLILCNLLQQLLALALFFLALINFSLQLLKLQIFRTFRLLLLVLKQEEQEARVTLRLGNIFQPI